MPSVCDVFRGIVVETKTKGLLGHYIYSDRIHHDPDTISVDIQPTLNELAKIPVIGIAAGVARMVLSIFHVIGHVFAAIVTCNKGHCYHAAKGACEFLRGLIEALPIAGRIFACTYGVHGEWWIIKIYNPNAPDTLDRYANNWVDLRQNRPSAYVPA